MKDKEFVHTVGDRGSGEGQALGGEVLGLGGLDGGLIDGDHGAVGVGHETAVGGSVGVAGVGTSVEAVVGVGVGSA